MKARKRYLLLIICIAFLTALYLGFVRLKAPHQTNLSHSFLSSLPFKSYLFPASKASHHNAASELQSTKRHPSYLEGHDVDISAPLRESQEKYSRKGAIWKPIQGNHAYSGQQEKTHTEFAANCRLSNCFNFTKCKPGDTLKIHIYPSATDNPHLVVSQTYQKILNVIRTSIYYEPDPSKACIFVTRYDSLDRDPLSPDYQKSLPQFMPLDNGRNHLLFNLYSGTWPNYHELDFSGFNPGYAMLVKASSSYANYRPGFDISLPLFSKTHPERGEQFPSAAQEPGEPSEPDVTISDAAEESSVYGKKSLLVFKGKRYIYGIGSETRNSLHHLHNENDVLIYTTCKHGKKWKELRDDRCERDNKEYENADYQTLMGNSTFCLAPRGRRLGSFRFLEALSFGCIPVTLSNDWVKPFNDVIDWSSVVVDGDERLLLQLPEVLRSFDRSKLERMRSQSLAIYENYFSSSLNCFLWNLVNPGFTSFSGAIWFDSNFSQDVSHFPGYGHLETTLPLMASTSIAQRQNYFTCVLYVNKAVSYSLLLKLIRSISRSQFIARIIVVWALPGLPPPSLTRSATMQHSAIPVNFVIPEVKTISAKLYPYALIETDCVLSLDVESTLTAEELDFAFSVWQAFPYRIVGFTPRDHYYDELRSDWFYTSKWTNQYSIILLDAAFYHRYYGWLYTHRFISSKALNGSAADNELAIKPFANVDRRLKSIASDINSLPSSNDLLYLDDDLCLDLVFNFLVSHLTREGPIKVTQRKKTSGGAIGASGRLFSSASEGKATSLSFSSRQRCFSSLINTTFGYLPLIKSQMRLDPVLFKDSVSNLRKKWRKLEQVS